MKSTKYPMILTAIFFILLAAGCSKEPVLDNESALFTDYVALEKKLDTTGSHPDPDFQVVWKDFMTKYDWNSDLGDIPDGIYEAFSVPDRYQTVHYIRFDVKDHQFVKVYYNEFPEIDLHTFHFSSGGQEGKRGNEDYTYRDFIALAYPKMEEELLVSQNPMEIDGISGASLSLYRFRIMIMKALYEYRNNTILNEKNYSLGENFDTSIFE